MSKTKQWAWDEAEKALDELIAKVKSGETVSTVLEYAKDKYRKISDDIKIANANPKNHSYLGFTYKPKIYNVQGNVEISHDIYYEGEWFAYMPTNPELPHSFVGQKLFRSYVKYLYKIIQKHHKEQKVGEKIL